MSAKPLLLTTGEPAGIGPDLCIQLADFLQTQSVVLCGDIHLLRERANLHHQSIKFHHHNEPPHHKNSLSVYHIPLAASVTPGQLNPVNADYVVTILDVAAQQTLAGNYAAIVTAPIHKGIICQGSTSQSQFSGHTEFFAEQTQSPLPVMVLGTQQLKVALITTHLPLRAVPSAITAQRLIETLTIIDTDMRRYFTSGRQPHIGVCGLNPHAGESGHMGHEEIDIINPTLAKLRTSGLHVSDALPADTLFVPQHANQYDIIVAMYHDQGLPVIKAQGFGHCVNMTFGLPIIRTSVDHGTALDLAGTTHANPSSLRHAIAMAQFMCTNS